MTASPMQSPKLHATGGRQTTSVAAVLLDSRLLLLDLRDIEEVGTIEEARKLVPALEAVAHEPSSELAHALHAGP